MSNLEKFLADITSWYWWTSVVLLGLGINLASSYLKPSLDRWADRWSNRRAERRAKDNARFAASVRIAVNDVRVLVGLGNEEIRLRLLSMTFFLFSFFMTSMAAYIKKATMLPSLITSTFSYFTATMSIVTIVFAMWTHKRAMEAADRLRAVQRTIRNEMLIGEV